jgi:hypothetical protein
VTEFVTHQFRLAGMEEAYDVLSQPDETGALRVALVRS